MSRTAIFAAGCFWGVQYYFDQVPGVIETEVGYIGGHIDNPTYEQVCSHTTGHAEAVKITYDPDAVIAGSAKQSAASGIGVGGSVGKQAVAFRILLRQFFRMHDPTQLNRQGPDVGDNYRSAIFYLDDDQKKQAAETIDELNKQKFNGKIVTTLEPASKFWRAEEYHQKFTEKTGQGACHIGYAPV